MRIQLFATALLASVLSALAVPAPLSIGIQLGPGGSPSTTTSSLTSTTTTTTAAPTATVTSSTTVAAPAGQDYGFAANYNNPTWTPQPIRGTKGGSFLQAPDDSNKEIDLQNPDGLAPPPTDSGIVPNLKWPFSLSHQKLLKGGWVREQVVTDLPASAEVAAAQVRLLPGAYRELHWHSVAEWGYVLKGSARVAVVDSEGRNQVSDIGPEDIWYFPKGIPHSIQALEDGIEFLVIFDQANFDAAGTTFMVDDWIAHTPKEVLAKNFGLDKDAFNNVPATDPYIFPGTAPGAIRTEDIHNPKGATPVNYTFPLSTFPKTETSKGWVKIVDSHNFPISKTIASALVFVQPGGLRELHWHPTGSEWQYYISGKARLTAFQGGATARTFDFQSGDTAVIPSNFGHYVENVGDEPLIYLEIFKSDTYNDISLQQWLALTPHDIVANTLNISIATVDQFKKEKQIIV
ncbi:hypothetical protein HDV00_007139 [Rhizophlyctis rosea]|nr:hypothetical protein HDV00_007139 [Rhizophlyctis rosea]